MQFQQTLIQSQHLKMNPHLYQSIKLMEMPSLDLREKIEEEIERNPALEILEDKITVPLDDAKRRLNKRARDQPSNLKYNDDYRSFIEGTLSRPETLQEHLIWQLQLEPTNSALRKIAETLIQNLNDDGFHIEDPLTLFNLNSSEEAIKPLIAEAIKLVQSLEPAGCCTKDYKESLKVQIELLLFDMPEEITPQSIDILIDNLDLIEREKYQTLAKQTGLDEDDVRDISEFIKTLSPFPGRAFAETDTVRYVIPDIKVDRVADDDGQDELVIHLNDEAFPVLGISKFYEKLIDTDDKTVSLRTEADLKAARDFARENIKEAQLFIDHLKKRNKTLIRTANAILQFQRGFFLNGPKYLVPLTLKDIAKELDLHETTISRIANGKYMQTEWGIFEIRYFFTNSVGGAGGTSKESVKEMIKEIIAAENQRRTHSEALLSDQEISALLSQKGIALARRTVAKYRKELDMGSSYTRKGGSK